MNKPATPSETTTAKPSVARASGIVSLMTLVSRVLGLVRDMAIAAFFGAGAVTDAFFVAFKIPNLLRRLVAEGSLSTAFLPLFVEERERSVEDSKRAVGTVTAFTLLLTLTLTALGISFSREITLLFAPGFETNPQQVALASELLSLMFPYIVLVSALALASSILNALGYFALPALAPALLNVSFIGFVFLVAPHLAEPVFALAWAVLVGGVLALLPQMMLLRKLGVGLHLRNPFGAPVVKRLIGLMLPTVLSSSFYQLMIFINTLLASMLVSKSVSWLFYADRLFQFPLGVFSMAIATAVLPALSRHAAQGAYEKLADQLSVALRYMTIITVPATVGLILLAEPLIALIFERGEFTSTDTIQTAAALCAFSIGLWSVSCQTVVVRAFLAQKEARLPSVVACGSIVLNIMLAFSFMGPAERIPDAAFGRWLATLQSSLYVIELAHVGLALAGSIASLVSLVVLVSLLPRVNVTLDLGPIIRTFLRCSLASAIMGGGLYTLMIVLPKSPLLHIALGVPLGGMLYGMSAVALGVSDVRNVYALVVDKLRR